MPIQTIDRGTAGDSGDKFRAGVAFDTCQSNDDYLDLNKVGTVATFAALASTVATAGQVIKFICHTTAGDLGGGDAEAYSAAHSATDGGLSINSATTGIRFRLINYAFVTPEMFGVNTANAGAGFTSALASGINKFVARGTYTVSTAITVPDDVQLDLTGATINFSGAINLFACGNRNKFINGTINGTSSAYLSGQNAVYCSGTRNGAAVAPTRKYAPKVYGTKFNNIGHYAISCWYTSGGHISDVEITNSGYCGVLGYSANDLHVRNIIVDTLAGETGSGELNAYGVTFGSDNSAVVDLVRDPVCKNCSVIGFYISNIPSWHGLDTHGGDNILFKSGKTYNCRRSAIITKAGNIGPVNCIVDGVEAINDLAAAATTSNGVSVHEAAFWIVGDATNKATSCVIKNSTSSGHGSYDSALSSIYLLDTTKSKIFNVSITSGFYGGISYGSGNTLVDVDGLYINNIAVNGIGSIIFGVTSAANDVTGTMKNLNIKGVQYGVYSTSATTGMTVISGEVSGSTYDYNVSAVWAISGHKERGTATITFTAANNATQAFNFVKKYKNSPTITGLAGQYEAGGVPVSYGYSALSNTAMTIRADTTTAASVSDTAIIFWEVEGD